MNRNRMRNESLVRRMVRKILREQKLVVEVSGSARSNVGTIAENIVRVSYGLPMVKKHMPHGSQPDLTITGVGPVEVKSVEGGRVSLEITSGFRGDELPSAEEFIALYLGGQKLWGVKQGKVYDLDGALVPQGRGTPTRDGRRLYYRYRIAEWYEVTTKHGNKKDCKAIIQHIRDGNDPASTCKKFSYPAVANGPKSIDFQGDWPTMDDQGDDSGYFLLDREHYEMPAIFSQGVWGDPIEEFMSDDEILADRQQRMKKHNLRLRKEKARKRKKQRNR